MVNISMQHGTSGASAHAYGCLGVILGPVFHRYGEGYRFARLACDLVEKHGFIADKAKVYLSMGEVALWTQPIATAIDFIRAAFRTATETGDLTYACYSMYLSVTSLLLRNDPLDAVWRESERGLDFVRKARFRDVADIIVSQQRFIATMQGRTATFSTFSDAQFDEAAFEAQLTGDRMPADDLLVLDPQTEGAVPVRRLRRGARGSRQGEGAALGLSRPDPAARLLLLHRADGGGAL